MTRCSAGLLGPAPGRWTRGGRRAWSRPIGSAAANRVTAEQNLATTAGQDGVTPAGASLDPGTHPTPVRLAERPAVQDLHEEIAPSQGHLVERLTIARERQG